MSAGVVVARRHSPASLVLIWVLVALLALAASLGTLWALNSSLYSASAFVSRYFAAVANDNIAEVLRTPGVAIATDNLSAAGLPASTSTALLQSGLISQVPSSVHVTADVAQSDGSHLVSVDYTLAGELHSSSYSITPAAALFGVMQRWQFAQSPLQLLSLQLNSGTHFTVGTLTLDARASSDDDASAFSRTANYLAVAPAVYSLSYNSTLVAAAPVQATVLPGQSNTATVDVIPTQALVDKVQSNLNDFLAKCATQTVLQPTGCPFGATIDDRLTSDPSWSLVTNPTVTLAPGDSGFVMPKTPGVAHLSVDVKSLFDGKASTVDKDIDYQVGLTVTLRDDGSIAIQLQ